MKRKNYALIEKLETSTYNSLTATELETSSNELLYNSQKTGDTYGATVAYYYLAFFYYKQGNTASCLNHISMCNELSTCNNYIHYYIKSCNLIGVIYVTMSEHFLALDYYLKGYYAAKSIMNYDLTSRILNNIGDMFQKLSVFEEALLYFKKAKISREQAGLEKDEIYTIICMNSIECQVMLNKEAEAKEMFQSLSNWVTFENQKVLKDIMTSNEILSCAREGNYKKAKELILPLLQNHNFYNEYAYAFNSLIRIKNVIYKLRDKQLGEQYIALLKNMIEEIHDINYHLRYQETVIEYYSIMEDKEHWQDAIVEYYYINEKSNKLRKANYYNSLIAKVQLEEILQEQAEILRHTKELETLSEIDELTQIFNRRAVEKYILKKLSTPSEYTSALIIMDLDHFKDINDTYGHVVGDIVLSSMGILLKNNFRENDIVGRLGGDEFIVFLTNIHKDPKTAKEIVSNRFSYLRKQIHNMQIEDFSCKTSASIGITLFQNYSSSSITQLYNSADTALYQAKKNGRDCFVFYDDI